jgi:hypothetical protein
LLTGYRKLVKKVFRKGLDVMWVCFLLMENRSQATEAALVRFGWIAVSK